MKKKKIIKIILITLTVFACLLYLWTKSTFTSYESEVGSSISSNIAGWNIKVNDTSLNDLIDDKTVNITDIKWSGEHVRDGKVSLGSIGIMNLNIDATGTDVAVRYDFTIIDQKQDSDKILLLNSLSSDNSTVIKTAENVYTVIVSLDDINNGLKPKLVLEVEWVNDDVELDYNKENNNSDFLEIDFNASQYNGATIVPYTG